MIKAVLFDMDGVLVDSEDLSIGIGIRYFEKKGYKADKKNFLSHLGTGMADFILGTASELGAFDVTVEDAGRVIGLIDLIRKSSREGRRTEWEELYGEC